MEFTITRTFTLFIFVLLYDGYLSEDKISQVSSMDVDTKGGAANSQADQLQAAPPVPDVSQTNTTAYQKDDSVVQSLPDDLAPFNEQLAGRGMARSAIGILKDKDGNLLKPNPVQEEVNFYEYLKKSTDPVLKELQEFIPVYLGTRTIKMKDGDVLFLHMEDIMKEYKRPCSIDVKIKQLIWDPPVDPAKPLRYKALTDAFGFGITGFKYFDVMSATEVRNDHRWVYTMEPHEGIQTLYKFVNGEIGIICGVVEKIVSQLQKIREWFLKQHHFIINNNSVLLTYDAEELIAYVKQVKQSVKNGNPNKDCKNFNVPVKVRMVFFGKVITITEDGKTDTEYLEALENFIPTLNNISLLNTQTYYDPVLSKIAIE